VHAIQRFGKNARRGSFAYATSSGKNVGMRHAIILDRVCQRFRDVFLSN
jgi:hypothetical protein